MQCTQFGVDYAQHTSCIQTGSKKGPIKEENVTENENTALKPSDKQENGDSAKYKKSKYRQRHKARYRAKIKSGQITLIKELKEIGKLNGNQFGPPPPESEQQNGRKRKRNDDDQCPATKKVKIDTQTKNGEVSEIECSLVAL